MKVGLSGPAYHLEPGDERDFPTDEAIRLIKADYAEAVAGQEIELAIKPPTMERRRGRGRSKE